MRFGLKAFAVSCSLQPPHISYPNPHKPLLRCMDILHDLIFGAMELGESPEKALAWRMLKTINDEPEAL